MKQPSVYSRSQIIDAAIALIREIGWPSVTTRRIAEKMGSSTMPIYSRVKSVDDLEPELRGRVRKLLMEFQTRPWTGRPLLDLAFGYVVFARDEKHLFRFLYLDRPEPMETGNPAGMRESFLTRFGPESPVGKALSEMEPAGQESVIQHTWIFTHGLAMLANSGALGTTRDEKILSFLRGAGEAFYSWSISDQYEEK